MSAIAPKFDLLLDNSRFLFNHKKKEYREKKNL